MSKEIVPRQRDLIFDALVEECYDTTDWRVLTKSERGRVVSASAMLKEVGATPEEIHRRAQLYRKRWRGIDLTPTGLAANWNLVNVKNGPARVSARDLLGLND